MRILTGWTQFTPTMNITWGRDLAGYQMRIARDWLKKGDEIQDPFSKFFYYYAGLNALSFLWGQMDKIYHDKSRMENLIKKIDDAEASIMVARCRVSVEFFSLRTIMDMNERDKKDPSLGKTPDSDPRTVLSSRIEVPHRKCKLWATPFTK